jgi:TIR domain-containing protein/carboxypeptidase family protein
MTEDAIFICYRREDSIAYAGRLYDRLAARFDPDHVFMDVDTVEPGEDFVEVIEKKIAGCRALIAVIGKGWLGAAGDGGTRRLDDPEDYVRKEIATALKGNVRVIPVLVGGAVIPRSMDLPEDIKALARRNAIEISDTAFHQGLARLIETLESDNGSARQSRWYKKPLWLSAAVGVLVLALLGVSQVGTDVSSPKPPDPTGQPIQPVATVFAGSVIDAATRRPISGATLEVARDNSVVRATSAATGAFRIDLPGTTGPVEIRLSAAGYFPMTRYETVAKQDGYILYLAPQPPPSQTRPPTPPPDPPALLRDFKRLLVNASDARFFGSDQMKAALQTNEDFAALEITIVDDPNVADVILEVGYTFPWDYPFSLTHRDTSIVLVSGKGVGRLSGPAGAASVARELARLLKPYRSLP